MTLLIVEDHPGMRALIRVVVGALADEVHECSDGAEALATFTTFHPDVVLMDLAMPHVDGIAATRHIRAAHPLARVVIVTDYDGPDLREAAHQAGASGYVLKEHLLDVRRAIETCLNTEL